MWYNYLEDCVEKEGVYVKYDFEEYCRDCDGYGEIGKGRVYDYNFCHNLFNLSNLLLCKT